MQEPVRGRIGVGLPRPINPEACAGQGLDLVIITDGTYDGSGSIRDYAAGAGRKFFDQLTEWRPYEGFLSCLLLSSHSSLTAQISVEHLDQEKLVHAFDFVEKHGDTISRLGAFEVGLRVLPDRPEVEPLR